MGTSSMIVKNIGIAAAMISAFALIAYIEWARMDEINMMVGYSFAAILIAVSILHWNGWDFGLGNT